MSSICKVLPSPLYNGEGHTHFLSHTADCSLTGTIDSIVGAEKDARQAARSLAVLGVCGYGG